MTQRAQDHGLTLRQVVEERRHTTITGPFVGSAATVADRLAEWFVERGCDGYNIHLDHPSIFRRFTGEVVPILQERGLFRTAYEATTLRGNLGLPVPVNRHTTARVAEAEARGA
ncbi:MAG: hypothetical protein QM747_00075 [Nocardioides sp.]